MTVKEANENEDEEVFNIANVEKRGPNKEPPPVCEVWIGQTIVALLVDTGATVNVMGEQLVERLCPKPQMKSTEVQIWPYGGNAPLPVQGVIKTEVRWCECSLMTKFYIVSGQKGPLMGCATAVMFGIVTFARQVKRWNAETAMERVAWKEPRGKRHEDVAAAPHDDRVGRTAAMKHGVKPHRRQPKRGKEQERLKWGERIKEAAVTNLGTRRSPRVSTRNVCKDCRLLLSQPAN